MNRIAGTTATEAVLVADLRALVEVESPSSSREALRRSAAAVAGLGERLLGTPPVLVTAGGGHHLHWTSREHPRLLLLGHHDTVWPEGSWTRTWTQGPGRVSGPGCFDMKAGVVLALHAAAALGAKRDAVEVLITSDEELGAPTSRELVAERAAAAGSVLVLEASADGGALKTSRAGIGRYHLDVRGRAAHAGLEPEKGVNAVLELAHQVLAITALAGTLAGAQITPTLVEGGATANTVPVAASLTLDVRCRTVAALAAVEAGLHGLRPALQNAELAVRRTVSMPPLESGATERLWQLAVNTAADLGLSPLSQAHVGGASDGNTAAAAGAQVLDGLGAVGGGAHAVGEWVDTTQLVPRLVLVTELAARIVRGETA